MKHKLSKVFTACIMTLLLSFSSLEVARADFVINTNQASNSEPVLIKKTNDEAVCYNKQTGVKYTSLNQACDMATNGQSIYTIPDLANPIKVVRELTIKTGTSLYIPYSSVNNNGVYENEVCDAGDNFLRKAPGTDVDQNASQVSIYRKTNIELYSQVNLIIQQGASLVLGGSFGTRGIISDYCQITMGDNSKIINNGTFDCFGYIKQSNSKGTGKLILNNGSITKTPICIYDLPGSGSTLNSLIGNNICPINLFDFRNLQCLSRINYGAKVIAIARFFMSVMSNDVLANKEIIIVDTVANATQALFKIKTENSYIDMSYITNNHIYSISPQDSNKYHNFDFYGNFEIGSFRISVSTSIVTIDIDTSKYFLPISYKFKIYLHSSTLISSYKLKIMPGGILNIDNTSTLTLNSQMIIYKTSDLGNEYGYPKGSANGTFMVNGRLVVNQNAKLGGEVLTENNNGSANIDLTNSNENSLICSSVEGINLKTYTLEMVGYHYDNGEKSVCQFKPGIVVRSAINVPSPVWERQDTYHTYPVKISVKNMNYEYNIFTYDIFNATNANGANEVSLISKSTQSSFTFNIREDKFFKVNIKRHNSLNIVGNFTNNTYLPAAAVEIEIVPNEGVKLICKTFKPTSGAGQIRNELFESFPGNNNFYKIHDGELNPDFTAYLIKNSYFKVNTKLNGTNNYKNYERVQFGGEFLNKWDSRKPEDFPEVNDNNAKYEAERAAAGQPFTKNTVYQAMDTVYIYRSGAGGVCLGEGTMILMGDKTYKEISQIKIEDKVMAFNHESGKYESCKLLNFVKHKRNYNETIKLRFDDNTMLTIIGNHELFDYTLKEYVEINHANYKDYIGHEFITYDPNNNVKTKVLVSGKNSYEMCDSFTLVSYGHMNIIANDMLTFTPNLHGLNDYFAYDDNLSFDKDLMAKDIATYGLYTYDDWKELVPLYMFEGYNFKYFKISIGKGLMTYQDVLDYITYSQSLVDDGEIIYPV